MATVNINGKEYEESSLSSEAKAIIVSLRFVKAELSKAEAQIAVLKTAESAYSKDLADKLEST
tara:strand:- start:55 stop:243 length:189 start_codon:yes stop_codon:yes gene_type:complete